MNIVRESIFISALRSFASAFTSVLGILLAVILVGFGVLSTMKEDLIPETSQLTILPDAKGQRKILSMNTPAILQLRIDGVIGSGDLTAEKISNLLLDSREGMLSSNRIKAVMLYMNSPGGTSQDSANIYHVLKKYSSQYSIPIHVFVDGLCASGGMYIASCAQKISATSNSVIGSVGVRMGPAFNFVGTMDKYGVKAATFTAGKDKDMLNPFRPWVEGEDASLKSIIAAEYEQFVDVVTSNRASLDKQKLINTYGAQVFIAKTAQDYGYIDEANTDYQTALTELLKAAQVDPDKEYQVVELSSPKSFFSEFSSSCWMNVIARYLGLEALSRDPFLALRGKILYLYEPMAPSM